MLTLVDTSVWIDHFCRPDKRLIELLESSQVLTHSSILGELAAGSIKNRVRTLDNFKLIPLAPEVPAREVLDFIELRKLHGRGLSWVDIQILASCLASRCTLLTNDRLLKKTFENLNKNPT